MSASSPPINSSPTILNPNLSAAGLGGPLTSNKLLTKQDREALLQYTKHFIRKCVQIIVQSRLGEKKPTKSRVLAYNSDWFNLSIKDIAQITTMTKSSLGNVETLFNVNLPFCIEISLKTPENQTMILETWCILFNDSLKEGAQKVNYGVYKKMSMVLRSLMSITRSTPTYQLSRRQSSDTYVLFYRMYCGEPIVHHLGDNYATSKVGTIGTPIGSIIVNLAYRTRLTMTPQTSSSSNEAGVYAGIQIKDDHFIPNSKQVDSQFMPQCSPTDNSPNSPNAFTKKPTGNLGFFSSSSSTNLNKRSSSNLNTIAEQFNINENAKSPTSRARSNTQPIPMRSGSTGTTSFQQQQQQSQSFKQAKYGESQRHSSELNQIIDESSTDEFNSSSVASTPDTMYYFKLKSAAFAPSASFNNNYYSSSLGNLNADNEQAPFATLLSNDFSNMNMSERANCNKPGQLPSEPIAQSPPPPQLSIEYNFQNRLRNEVLNGDEGMASPCSLPNFKLLDNQLQHNFTNLNHNENNRNFGNASFIGALPDDFVFIESKKIAFGLSNAANDLSTFFRACENAPILDSFQNEPCLSDTLKDLDQHLLVYESKVAEFEELIKSLENSS